MNNLTENADNSGGTDLDYLREVKSSTCLLLSTTPSPTPIDFKHPLSEEMSEQPFLSLNGDPDIVNVPTDASAGDSSSSGDSNSVVQDPVSAQLINNISMLDYQTLSKNGDLIIGEAEDCKLNGNLKIKNIKLPGFVNWKWDVIRKALLWVVISGLIACLGSIIAMVITLPKECDPDVPWYQGKVFYEVFPASFKDSNNDGTGDLKGLINKLDYIQNMGVSAIRLNYIFEAPHYPENFNNITSLSQIDRSIGILKDLQDLIAELHARNMYLVLDLPVSSMAVPVSTDSSKQAAFVANDSIISYLDETTIAIDYWAKGQNVDGFYLKNLENFVDEPNFGRTLQIWKQIIGFDKILIASEKSYTKAKRDSLNVLLSRIDLIDIHINLNNGITSLKNRINEIINGVLFEKPHYPWVHWNIGNVNSERISTNHHNNTLALTVLEFVLPGTISIFYGDEIGLGGMSEIDVEKDFHEHKNVHNLVPMAFANTDKNDNSNVGILPWNSKSVLEPQYYYLDLIKDLVKFRSNTPTVYLQPIYNEGDILKKIKIRETKDNLVVIERCYPRRNTLVFVGNLGDNSITTDLSSMYYGGLVVAGTNKSLVGQTLYFDKVTFPHNSAIIFKMDK